MKSVSCIIAGIQAFMSSVAKDKLMSGMKDKNIFSEVIKISILKEFGARNQSKQINVYLLVSKESHQ